MALQYKPMLCESAPKQPDGGPPQVPTNSSYAADEWIIERKENGWRFIFKRTEDGIESYGGRDASNRTGQPAAIEQALMFLPPGTVLDAEVIAVGQDSAAVSHHLAHGLPLRAIIFDVLELAGTDLRSKPWKVRRLYLEAMAEAFDGDVVAMSIVQLAEQRIHDLWIEEGYEGSVAKRTTSKYHSGVRSWNWVKVKPQLSMEGVVTGFVPGKGGRTGEVGAFEVILPSGIKTSVGTRDDQQRADIKAHPEQWLGSVIEFRYHGLMTSGSPRHPVSPHRRDDRTADEVLALAGHVSASHGVTGPGEVVPGKASHGRSPQGMTGLGTAPNGGARSGTTGRVQAPQIPTEKGRRMRNYSAMRLEKLEACVHELEVGAGDAYERVVGKDEDVAAHLKAARDALAKKKVAA